MEILTQRNFATIDTSDETEFYLLREEQNSELESRGYDDFFEKCHPILFNGQEIEFMTINDAIQCLDLKNGADLVRYDNGNIGFYNEKSRMEILYPIIWGDFTTHYGHGAIDVFTEGISLEYIVYESEVEQAISVLDKAVEDWHTDDDLCKMALGDLATERLSQSGIHYTEL